MQAQYNQLKLCLAPSIAHLFTPKGVKTVHPAQKALLLQQHPK